MKIFSSSSSSSSSFLFVLLCFFTLLAFSTASNVSYDHRSLIIDGQRKLLISAAIHYPRSVPAMWPGLVQTAKEGGVDVIESYVFWNGHELSPGQYYFGGRYDLVKFVKTIHQAGMYMILRIGPFVAAEWNYGGVPAWLHYVPGTVFRTDNEPFKHYMQKFMTVIVDLMKREKLFAAQGGPIILAQVENEYGYYEQFYGEGGKRYAQWSAQMALAQNTGVPWIMCQQWDAPDPVVSICFQQQQLSQLVLQTDPKFGLRTGLDVLIVRLIAKYHGGTNFGRTAGGPFITTSYDYDAPVDEYGLPRLPKWSHLKELHKAIKLCENALLHGEKTNHSLGPSQEVDVYTDASGPCAAFISNTDDKNDKIVEFRNVSYSIPAWSVSILPDCKNVVFNTAKVKPQASVVKMVTENLRQPKWEIFVENAGTWGEADLIKNSLDDHINITKDTSDYLWITTSIVVSEDEEFLKKGTKPLLLIESKGHALHVFVNKGLLGSASGNGTVFPFKFKSEIPLKAGKNEIALLSMTVGLPTAGPYYEFVGAGLTSVKIKLSNQTLDLSKSSWSYKIGVQGEILGIYKAEGMKSVKWTSTSDPPKMQPLTWYKATVDPPGGNEPIGLDMLYMGKGMAWLNGEEIGRYWPRKSSKHDKCVVECNYRGKFMPDKCFTGCGEPTQRWYHVPRSWFKPSENVLVVFEEKGGDPARITFARRTVSS
ncbi:hypothetical protein ACFE04_016083 [Oxalis oulophora]